MLQLMEKLQARGALRVCLAFLATKLHYDLSASPFKQLWFLSIFICSSEDEEFYAEICCPSLFSMS